MEDSCLTGNGSLMVYVYHYLDVYSKEAGDSAHITYWSDILRGIIGFMTNYMVLFLSDDPSYASLPIDALLERGRCLFHVQTPR